MALLIPDDSLLHFSLLKITFINQNKPFFIRDMCSHLTSGSHLIESKWLCCAVIVFLTLISRWTLLRCCAFCTTNASPEAPLQWIFCSRKVVDWLNQGRKTSDWTGHKLKKISNNITALPVSVELIWTNFHIWTKIDGIHCVLVNEHWCWQTLIEAC